MNGEPIHSAEDGAPVYTVGDFSQRLKELFRKISAFNYLGVSGEISEWTPRSNGVYFTLKDADVTLQCFAYPQHARKFPNLPIGAAIVAYGSVRVATWRSRYELLVTAIRATGIGELYRQYEALKEQFKRLGYFESSRKRPIPAFPRFVAVVSARGKGAEDFITTLGSRAPQVRCELIETRVQGLGADVEIATALDRAIRLGADVIVLARGGGSYEDLFAFNREPVVRAVVHSPTPVITAIGHTADHHLADDVADFVCETPSNAAQFIASLWQRGGDRLARLTVRLDRELRDVVARALQRADAADEALSRAWERGTVKRRERVASAERALFSQSPGARVAQRTARLASLDAALRNWPLRVLPQSKRALDVRQDRLASLAERYLSQRQNALTLSRSRLLSSDPEKPLERGYAIVLFADRALRDARDVAQGDSIVAKLYRGSVTARVERVSDDE